MQLKNDDIKQFLADQTLHGTRVALSNFVFQQASSMLKGIGVRRVSVIYAKEPGAVITAISNVPARKRKKK